MARGREADIPTEIPAKGWKDIALRLKDRIAEDQVGLIAAGVAFYGFLALFPAIAALMAISGVFIDPTDVAAQIESVAGLIPQDIVDIILDQITAVTGADSNGLSWAAAFGLALAFYSASNGVGSLIGGLNVAYAETETRGFIALKLRTFALTLFMIIGMIVGLITVLALPSALLWIDLGPLAEPVILVLSFALLACLTISGLAVVYRFGPARDAPEWVWASPGSILACLLWMIGSAGFAFYVSNFGSYNETFGALGGVVVLLTWLWLSAFIVLIGAELNAEMEAQTRRDTTQGRDLPMGHRDAQKADTLGKVPA